jgi:hypothetical protein
VPAFSVLYTAVYIQTMHCADSFSRESHKISEVFVVTELFINRNQSDGPFEEFISDRVETCVYCLSLSTVNLHLQ